MVLLEQAEQKASAGEQHDAWRRPKFCCAAGAARELKGGLASACSSPSGIHLIAGAQEGGGGSVDRVTMDASTLPYIDALFKE